MTLSPHPVPHRRTLNVFVLAMLSLAAVISLRNLPLTAEYGLSALFFYFLAAIFFMVPYALVSAELASGWPKGGGIYIWVKEALGNRLGFVAVWMQWFHMITWYPAMLAFIAAGFAQLINPALADNRFYLVSVILAGIWAVTFFNFLGVKKSAFLTTVFVIAGSIVPAALLMGVAILWMSTGKPLAISFQVKDLIPNLNHISNLVFLGGVFLAVCGLEVNANLAREVKRPQKNYPRAILIAALLTIVILTFGSLAIGIVIPKNEIGLVSGVFDAFKKFFSMYHLDWLIPVVALLTVIGAVGELNAWTIAGVKGLFATTEHGCLPPTFHKTNKRQVPVNLMFAQAILVTIAALIFLYLPNVNLAFWILSAVTAQMYLVMYILLFATGIVLRYRKPDVVRTYRVPGKNIGMWIISCVGILASLFALAIVFFPPTTISVGSTLRYELLLCGCLLVSILLPLILYALRKPHWKLAVLRDIREEIHRSTHGD